MARETAKKRTLEKKEHNLYGAILHGVEGTRIELQARYFGEDVFHDEGWDIRITGMAGGAVSEVQARIAGAFAKHGYRAPEGQILINLSPAGIPKFGTSLDLPIAMISLQAAGYAPDLPAEIEKTYLFVGELSLHGEIRRIPGALPIALCAQAGNTIVVPKGNEKECCLVRGLPGHETTRIAVAEELDEVLRFMKGQYKLRNAMAETPRFQNVVNEPTDFSTIRGQDRAKRALLIAAAGGHNVLMVGPPGEGKSLLAGALPGIMPALTNPEKIELTRIYSAKGLLSEDGMVVSRRPFRIVHHTASKQALVGGGSGIPAPGEITLAHRGVMFLDELAEFSRSTLETLRQPIESGVITISRVDATLAFPAQCSIVAAMNPCPCGFFGQHLCKSCMAYTYEAAGGCQKCGHPEIESQCRCTKKGVESYRKKISGPILDRIDLHVELRPLSVDERFETTTGESTSVIREKVNKAREIQHQRYSGSGIPYNAAIPGGQLMKWLAFEEPAMKRYKKVIAEGSFTTRATDRTAKIARTISDLAGVEKIQENHIVEAAEFISGSPLA